MILYCLCLSACVCWGGVCVCGGGGGSYKDQHFPGTPYPAAMISDHSSSSKIFLPPLTFH